MTDIKDSEGKSDRIRFNYLKSNYFRIIHADGVYGGITPQGAVNMNFFSERAPISQIAVHEIEINEDTNYIKLGPEMINESVRKDGIVRELEAGIMMSVDQAKVLRDWLDGKLKELEEQAQAPKSESNNIG